MRRRIIAAWALARRSAFAGTALALTVALACTLLGAGALGQAVRLADGNVWLWNSPDGQIARTNSRDGRVDLVTQLPESAGHDVRITQTDDHLILHDLDTGRMTSIDLATLAFSGRADLSPEGDLSVALDAGRGVIVDRKAGEVRAVDPATLTATGEALKLPAPLVGGRFDAQGTLWVGAPSQGTVTGVRVDEGGARAVETAEVADPGDDVAMTVRDQGPLVANRSDDTIVEVRGGETAETDAPLDLADAVLPPRTPGDLVAVTLPGAGRMLALPGPHDGGGAEVLDAGDVGSAVAVPYEGRVYLPDEGGRVRVFEADGAVADPISLEGASGPLGLEVREGYLFVNAPESGTALVIGPSGDSAEVDTAAPPGPGGPAESPAPDDGGPAPLPPDVDPGTEPEPGTGPALPEPSAPPVAPLDPGGAGTDPLGGLHSGTGQTAAGAPPGAPVPVSASVGEDGVTVSWQPSYSASPVTEYVVSWEDGSTTVSGDRTSALLPGLEDGGPYRFQVQAVNAYGYSAAAASPQVAVGDAPPAPGGVSAEATGAHTAELEWEPAPGADDYVVSAESADGGVVVRSTSETGIELTGLAAGRTYTFSVAARGEDGVRGLPAASEPVALPFLDAPEEVWAATTEQGGVNVYWSPVEGAAEYVVEPSAPGLQERRVTAGEPVTVGGEPYQSTVYGDAAGCSAFAVRAVDSDGNTSLPSTPDDQGRSACRSS
ncbi:fibronectin type III domain-containing protein [Streptomonospora arabica]|uniref:Fibronectin type III domain-containing protein n=1 Tax=Streptomonospora arabica TaxID=412417 RepID=A0ABV9SMI4_9ACTN